MSNPLLRWRRKESRRWQITRISGLSQVTNCDRSSQRPIYVAMQARVSPTAAAYWSLLWDETLCKVVTRRRLMSMMTARVIVHLPRTGSASREQTRLAKSSLSSHNLNLSKTAMALTSLTCRTTSWNSWTILEYQSLGTLRLFIIILPVATQPFCLNKNL